MISQEEGDNSQFNLKESNKVNKSTQTEETFPSFKNIHYSIQALEIYEDKKLFIMLLKAKNSNIFTRAENCINFLSFNKTINRSQYKFILKSLSSLSEIISEKKCDKVDYLKAILLQKILLENLIKITKELRSQK